MGADGQWKRSLEACLGDIRNRPVQIIPLGRRVALGEGARFWRKSKSGGSMKTTETALSPNIVQLSLCRAFIGDPNGRR